MQVNRELKEELNKLSKEVFGSSSRWQKLVNKGYHEPVTEEVTEYIPDAEDNTKDGTMQKVQVPTKRNDGAHLYTTKYHTVESIKEYMLDRKKQLEELRAQIAIMQAEAQSKKKMEELTKKVNEDISGSAI